MSDPKWVRVGVATGTRYVDLAKAYQVEALEDPNNAGSFVIGLWFNTDIGMLAYQTVAGGYTTLADAETALQRLVQGYDPSA